MNPQDIAPLLTLVAVLGGCFGLAFIDPWLARRRYRRWYRSMTAEQRPNRNYGESVRDTF